MVKYTWELMIWGMLVLSLMLCGCTVENDGGRDVVVVDDTPPAMPRGVYSVTGDEEVRIEWYPNQETDLKGYYIYRSFSENEGYKKIATVGSKVSSYVDNDVENGKTYYYAVSAFDFDGNESDLSPEIVDDTPRPAGKNVRLKDYILEPDSSGFDFSRPEKGAQPFDRSGVDVYFGVGVIDDELTVPYVYAVSDDIGMQDLGYTDSMDDVDASPVKGFTFGAVEAVIGHTYAFLTLDKHYAKIRVTDLKIEWEGDEIVDAWFTFDWAYQLQSQNPELAPAKIKGQLSGNLKGGMVQ